MESSGADITTTAKDLTLSASWSGDGLLERIWSTVQNTGSSEVLIFQGATAPSGTDDNRWQKIPADGAVDMLDSGLPIWARTASGSSTLAAIPSGPPDRYSGV